MTYKRISEFSDLPLEGRPLAEDLRFDMKMEVKAAHESKLANDVAAFANTAGGVLLIGAVENPPNSGILERYDTMSHANAELVGEVLKKAMRLCSPTPIAESKPIVIDAAADKYVVAINCEPYAAPPIGVMIENQRGDPKHWCFPARRGRDTHNLRPEELATIMEPHLRRKLLMIERIPSFKEESRRALFHCPNNVYDLHIVSISAEDLSMHLMREEDSRHIIVPLDAVQMIWREVEPVVFHISLDGVIIEHNSGFLFLPHYPG